MDAPQSLLFSEFKLRGVTFPNRVVIAPMQMYKSGQDGRATDWHFQHLTKYAIGGAGTVMTEALIVDPIGRFMARFIDRFMAPCTPFFCRALCRRRFESGCHAHTSLAY